MAKEITHSMLMYSEGGNTFTINALCGYFETYDFDQNKKFDTPFVSTSDFTCEDCKAEYALQLLAALP